MMKRIILIIALVAAAVGAHAELQDRAFVVYYNDGSKVGFLMSEVVKIGYSRTDNAGNLYDDYVTHEIQTVDSIYRYPIENVDSVSFEKPKMVLQPNVVRCDEASIADYLLSVDDMTLTFRSDMPAAMRPQRGQVLTNFDPLLKPFDGVWAGKVVSTAQTGAGIVVTCDYLDDITDVYERLYGVDVIDGRHPAYIKDKEGMRRHAPARIDGEGTSTIPYSASVGGEFEWKEKKLKFGANFTVEGEVSATIVYDIDLSHQFMTVRLNHSYQPSLNFTCARDLVDNDGDFKYKHTWGGDAFREPVIQIVSPTAPLLNICLAAGAGVYWQGSVEFGVNVAFPKRETKSFYFYNDGIYKHNTVNVAAAEPRNTEFSGGFSLKGTAHAGLLLASYVGTTKAFKSGIGFYSDILVGPRLSGQMTAELNSGGASAYRSLHNTKIEFSPAAAEIDVSFISSFYQDAPSKYQIFSALLPGSTYSVPLLPNSPYVSSASIQEDYNPERPNIFGRSGYVRAYWNPTRSACLLPVYQGVALVDGDNRILEMDLDDSRHWSLIDGAPYNGSYESRLYNWILDKHLRVRPVLQCMGVTFFTDNSGSNVHIDTNMWPTVKENAGEITAYHANLDMTCTLGNEVTMHPILNRIGFYMAESYNDLHEMTPGKTWFVPGECVENSQTSFYASYTPEPAKTYYYIPAVQYGDGRTLLGESIQSIITAPYIYRGIDFHLPSGLLWSRLYLGQRYGAAQEYPIYAFPEEYYEMQSQGWRLPTKEEVDELLECTNWGYPTNQFMEAYPIGGGEGRHFLNGHHWTDTHESIPVKDSEDNIMKYIEAQYTLYTTPPNAHRSYIDLNEKPNATGYILLVRYR